jgi:hypothetical protein
LSYFDRIAQEWQARARELADWTMRVMVNRTDVWGRYLPMSNRKMRGGFLNHAITAPFRDERGKVFLDASSLEKHYKTTQVGGVLGLHTSSSDFTSRWLAIDIDLHEAENLSVTPEGNFVAARHWHQRLVQLGFDPLLMDSNGQGGFHLLVYFANPMSTQTVHQFGKELVADYSIRGLDVAPEVFPGSERFDHYGDWLRLPGRHHTRQHYTRVFTDEAWAEQPWLTGHDAIDRILATQLASIEHCEKHGIYVRRQTVCLDFDGVVHSYRSGWQGATTIADPPIHGTAEAIAHLRKRYRVVIHSARCATAEGRDAISAWLLKHRIEIDEVCEHKPPALVYIDDRAIRFQGSWADAISELSQFRK